MTRMLATVVALGLLGSGLASDATSSLAFDAEAAKNRPVTKVITLLKDMLKQLEKEAEEDEEVYDKLACWCETNDKEKTKSIADAEAHIASLTTAIEEFTATSAQLNTEIKNLEVEVAKNQDALDKATALREKQLAEFNAEEKDVLQSVSALKSAITVLGKHNSASLLQVSEEDVKATLARTLQKHDDLLQGVLSKTERDTVAAFVQSEESYAPQSGEIFGILGQMKETFETNLANSQKEEAANQKAYNELKAAKETEIAAGQERIDTKTGEMTAADEKKVNAKEDLADTKASLAADEEFLAMLKDKCSMTDKEWEERQKTRQLEMEACSKALAVLSGDDAHDLFTKTFNAAFMQKSKAESSNRRSKAAVILSEFPRLSNLATQVRLDAFTKVVKSIDDMIAELKTEKTDEIKHKDFCIDEFNANELETQSKDRTKADHQANIEDLSGTIKELASNIDTLNKEIEEMKTQMKRAGEDREKENAEFQQTVADQRATQKLLQNALSILEGFYNKKAAVLMQQKEPAGPPPPPGFTAYKKNAASGGVMGMMQQIINDAKSMEAEAIRAEEDAQKAYEDFVQETNSGVEAKNRDVVNKSEVKASAEADLVEQKEGLENTLLQLEQLANYKAELHGSCDFILKNFDIRQSARDDEMEALREAKAILKGAGR